ncbi:ribonuclease H family protein [Clostridium sp. CCUG 7971]|uniref:ribonuclease H1 domain-containing protein n=1 Tax=Clostridium sp. CCUG 7971 TaxID=2811414 RepID=UPI001ABAF808|nr:ribonuclease H family protein [Clostridium sp. CCUG 7971]MBO3445186.1 ribonuclease H family protein [Clostridium sp. CCUG 7971]
MRLSKKKFYAVRKGKKTGIFNTWNECKMQVDGYSGAEYKSFTTIDEAKEFIEGNKATISKNPQNSIEAYVDGSYEHSLRAYGSGIVMIKDNIVQKTYSVKGEDESLVSMRNVAGEIEASKIAMGYCISNNIENLTLYFDYEGIEKWCIGAWKTNKEGTIEYKKFYDSIKDKLNVKFVKVKAHSGDKYNEEADKLAKAAIGI